MDLRGSSTTTSCKAATSSIQELDGVSTAHPIFVYYVSMHTATGNSAAFKLAGVTASTGELPGGGHFGKDADGNLNGMIFEPPALSEIHDRHAEADDGTGRSVR